jgi:hypothetical protein
MPKLYPALMCQELLFNGLHCIPVFKTDMLPWLIPEMSWCRDPFHIPEGQAGVIAKHGVQVFMKSMRSNPPWALCVAGGRFPARSD